MKRHVYLLAVAGFLIAPALLIAEDVYTIKLRKSARGDVTSVVRDDNTVSRIKARDGDILTRDDTIKFQENLQYREEILAVDDRDHATRIRRHYEKAQKTDENGTADCFIQGKKVIIEKSARTGVKKGKGSGVGTKPYRFFIDGAEEITGENAESLDKEFNCKNSDVDEDRFLLPQKKVAVAESWEIHQIAEFFKEMIGADDAIGVNLKKATGTGKLTRVYKKGDAQWGVIEFQFRVPVNSIGDGKARIVMDPDTLYTMTLTMDTCIDGTSGSGEVKTSYGLNGKGKISSTRSDIEVEVDIQGISHDVIVHKAR